MHIRRLFQKILFILIFLSTSLSFASSSEVVIQNIYKDWCKAIGLSKGDVQQIVKYYAKDAVLLPTLSAKILRNNINGDLTKYFVHLASLPNIKCTSRILITQMPSNNLAVNSGYYEFSYTENGTIKKIPARFNFVYKKVGHSWLIINQHSSVLP